MKIIALITISLAISTQADENYQSHYDHYNPSAYPTQGADVQSAYASLTEKQDELDLNTILPIAVFGGLGIGALAYIDSLNRYNNLCNKVKEMTAIARTTTADGTLTSALAHNAVATAGSNTAANNANTIINSNRVFINSLAAISDLAC
jgi:hypothetical protein